MNLFAWLTPANALAALAGAALTAVIGLWQNRKMTLERYDRTIDEYSKIEAASRVRIDELEKTAFRAEERNLRLRDRVSHLEGHRSRLIEEIDVIEEYCRTLRARLLQSGQQVPPWPQIEKREESETT